MIFLDNFKITSIIKLTKYIKDNAKVGAEIELLATYENFDSADAFCRYLLDNCGIFTIPWDEVEPYVRLSMTFKISSTEENFYITLNERLQKIKKSR